MAFSTNTHTFPAGSKMPQFVPTALRGNDVTIHFFRYNVRREDAGFIIGTKGFKVKRFMRDTGANIALEHLESGSVFMVQALNPQAVQAAVALIETEARKAFALNTGRKQKTQHQQHYQLTVPVVPATAGLLIGRGGATCRGIKQKLKLAGLRVDTKDGNSTVRLSGKDLAHCQTALAQLQQDFPTVFFVAPPAPRKQSPRRSSPPTRPPPIDFGAGGGGRPVSPIDLYMPGGADGPRTPQEFVPYTPPGTPPHSPHSQRKSDPPTAFFSGDFP